MDKLTPTGMGRVVTGTIRKREKSLCHISLPDGLGEGRLNHRRSLLHLKGSPFDADDRYEPGQTIEVFLTEQKGQGVWLAHERWIVTIQEWPA